jgi:hypothetical protein
VEGGDLKIRLVPCLLTVGKRTVTDDKSVIKTLKLLIK